MTIGMNLAVNGNSYYGEEYPFLDRFKTSGSWVAQGTDWSTMNVSLSFDGAGNPLSVPAGARQLYTMVGVDPVSLPTTDRYVLTYGGTAQVAVGSSTVVSAQPGKVVFDFTGSGNMLQLAVQSISASDPIHDIHIVREDQVAQFQSGAIFNPAFVEKAAQWDVLRFMQWGETIGSSVKNWQDRAELGDASWGKSVPIEVMVRLANETKTDMWYNIPAQASDDYVRSALDYIKANLNPDQKLHLEYSNEMWNWSYSDAQYAQKMSDALFGSGVQGGWVQYYGYRSAQVAAIVDQVFGDASKARVDDVLATQADWPGLESYIFKGIDAAHLGSAGQLFEEYATTTYFGANLMGFNDADKATILSWARGGAAGMDAAFKELATGGLLTATGKSLADTKSLEAYQAGIAQKYGLQLVAYEGGVHVTAGNFAAAVQPEIVAFFTKLMNDPRMGTLYSQMASDFSANGGGELVAYQDTGGPSVWGHWGVLDNIYQTSSPRYDALLNFQRNSLSTVTAPAPATTTTTDSMATSASSTVTPTVDPTKIIGTSGSDSLAVGGAYDTTIDALGGNDTLIGGAGKNMLIGGAGDDSYTIVDGDDLVIELSSGGHDKVTSSVDYSLTANVEDLFLVGSAHNGVGNSLANILQGGAGDDMLSGLAGNDILCGGGGNDRLIGGDGNDRLVGGAGADSLAGGAGADIFSFNVGDFTSGSGALDRIEDFSSRRKDRIDFSAMDANPATSVNDSFTFIGKQAFHHVAGEMRYEAIGGSSYVMGDLDGNGVADFQITVVGVTSFRSSDFLF